MKTIKFLIIALIICQPVLAQKKEPVKIIDIKGLGDEYRNPVNLTGLIREEVGLDIETVIRSDEGGKYFIFYRKFIPHSDDDDQERIDAHALWNEFNTILDSNNVTLEHRVFSWKELKDIAFFSITGSLVSDSTYSIHTLADNYNEYQWHTQYVFKKDKWYYVMNFNHKGMMIQILNYDIEVIKQYMKKYPKALNRIDYIAPW